MGRKEGGKCRIDMEMTKNLTKEQLQFSHMHLSCQSDPNKWRLKPFRWSKHRFTRRPTSTSSSAFPDGTVAEGRTQDGVRVNRDGVVMETTQTMEACTHNAPVSIRMQPVCPLTLRWLLLPSSFFLLPWSISCWCSCAHARVR